MIGVNNHNDHSYKANIGMNEKSKANNKLGPE